MKIKNVKLIMIIGMLLINLFFGFFFQNILAAVIDLDDMDSDELKEKLESKTVSGDTLDYLQYSARKRNKAYYEFDVNNMLGKSTEIYEGNYDEYDINKAAAVCISPGNHEGAYTQKIDCIMDVTSESVIVYKATKDKNGKLQIKKVTTKRDTKDKTKKEALEYADQLTFFAHRSIVEGEETTPDDFASYSSNMRFQIFMEQASYFKELGVPEKFLPTSAVNYTDNKSFSASNTHYNKGVKEMEKELKNSKFYGRFVFLYGYTSTGANSGQNDMIFSARMEDSLTLKIKKVSESGNGLKGAKFSIYYATDKDGKGDLIASNKVTNKHGYITCKLKKGKYYIEETTAPSGYNLSNPSHKIVDLKEDKQEESFSNPIIKTNLKIRKEDKTTKVGLANVEFKVTYTEAYLKDDTPKNYVGQYVTVDSSRKC